MNLTTNILKCYTNDLLTAEISYSKPDEEGKMKF